MTETVRVLRVLEYTGPRAALERCLAQNAVKGTEHFGDITVREAVVGNWPEVLTDGS